MTLQIYPKYYSRPQLRNNAPLGMNIQSKNATPPIHFSGNENTDGTSTQNDFWKIGAAIAATALVTIAVTTLLCRHFSAKQLEKLEQECQKLRKNGDSSALSKKIEEQQHKISKLEKSNNGLKAMLSDQNSGKYYNDLKAKIDSADLDYDVMNVPKVASENFSEPRVYEDAVKLPERISYPGNKYHETLDFDNEYVSIKILEPGQKGKVYYQDKEIEILNGRVRIWSSDEADCDIFIKKLPDNDFTYIINDKSIRLDSFAADLADKTSMSNDDMKRLISQMQPFWKKSQTTGGRFFESFLNGLTLRSEEAPFHIKFPQKEFVSESPNTDFESCKSLKICWQAFEKLGMKTEEELFSEANKHVPVQPSELQKRKMLILKEAIKELTPSLSKSKFKQEEIDTKIYLFDKNSLKESFLLKKEEVMAQAIVDYPQGFAPEELKINSYTGEIVGTSKGFWIDKTYLEQSDFGEVLENALHELSHKIGGDETSEFSYLLTEVNAQTLNQLLETHPETYKKLCALNKLWKECSSATAQA